MTPLTENPTVVVLVDSLNNIVQIATNVSPETKVIVTKDSGDFDNEAQGMPFNH